MDIFLSKIIFKTTNYVEGNSFGAFLLEISPYFPYFFIFLLIGFALCLLNMLKEVNVIYLRIFMILMIYPIIRHIFLIIYEINILW
jgi:hypothetical protein